MRNKKSHFKMIKSGVKIMHFCPSRRCFVSHIVSFEETNKNLGITAFKSRSVPRFYRPQRRWGKVIFSQACVKNSVHRGGVCPIACWDTHPLSRHRPRAYTPWQTTPLWADTPWADTPSPWADTPSTWADTHLGRDTLG